jgi:hypothetical protein
MQIKKKELGLDITAHFDKPNSELFLKDFKQLVKKYEFISNSDKLKYSILLNSRKRPTEEVKGWCSRIITEKEGVQECIFLDYDGILKEVMIEELKFLQDKYNLSPFIVLKSFESKSSAGEIYGNFLCISTAKKYYSEAIEILSKTHCDSSFKVVPTSYFYKTWVTRLGKKFRKPSPSFDSIVGDLSKDYSMSCSQAHQEVLEELYPEIKNKIKYTNLDGNHKYFTSIYFTASK